MAHLLLVQALTDMTCIALTAAGESITQITSLLKMILWTLQLFFFKKTRLLSHLETFSTTGPMRNNNLERLTGFNQFLEDET